ncbi:MAG: NAD(P)-binding domain-containing protein [Alphaproteobacteria bacterium]|nr:NAD(P)-binding domain-containing protein [Alphaproteobacteria bacterium]
MKTVQGVYLSETIDLKSYYSEAFEPFKDVVSLHSPSEVEDANSIEFALCWEPADDAFNAFPALKLISSIAAGVHNILRCSSLPQGVPITRVRDPQQAKDMAAFAVRHVVDAHRHMAEIARQETARIWNRIPYGSTQNFRVAVLGYGLMGHAASDALSHLGYDVVAYAKHPRTPAGPIRLFSEKDGILAAVHDANVVIDLMPATDDTTGILDETLFSTLAEGAALIQLGRGQHLVEDDLLAALQSGQIRHAALDVFSTEPLPNDHVFWSHPKITVTPHIVAESSKDSVARLVVDDIRSVWSGMQPARIIDRSRGY